MPKFLVPAFFVVDAEDESAAGQAAIEWAVQAKTKHENIFLATDDEFGPVKLGSEYEIDYPYTMEGLVTGGRFIVIAGNPKDGFSYFGYFGDSEEAADWAESELKNDTWWTVEIDPP